MTFSGDARLRSMATWTHPPFSQPMRAKQLFVPSHFGVRDSTPTEAKVRLVSERFVPRLQRSRKPPSIERVPFRPWRTVRQRRALTRRVTSSKPLRSRIRDRAGARGTTDLPSFLQSLSWSFFAGLLER